ncbi:MAG TPA: L,D-transpeptidase [Solirubrobacteraceae bacterium]|nr:L,D-transpeptidase [Solirubrobacteraceae bacterium]
MTRRARVAPFGWAVLAACALAAPAQASTLVVPSEQRLAILQTDHVARTAPDLDAPRIESVPARRPLTGVPTALPVIRSVVRDRRTWLRVRLPGRPSGHRGWIRARRTRESSTGWHLVVDLSARSVTAFAYGRAQRRFSAVVGKPSTPTPRGRFFIEEGVAVSSAHGGPYALATSARSSVLQFFAGGPGQIALHGTRNLAGAPGTAASHGCIRLRTPDITWLARRIDGGVPLTIRS